MSAAAAAHPRQRFERPDRALRGIFDALDTLLDAPRARTATIPRAPLRVPALNR